MIDSFPGHLLEPSFNQIGPGKTGRNEMDVKSWMLLQPCLYLRMLAGATAINDGVQAKP